MLVLQVMLTWQAHVSVLCEEKEIMPITTEAENLGLVSIEAASEILGVNTVTIWRWVRSGRLPTVHIDGSSHKIYRRATIEKLKRERLREPRRRGKNRKRV